MQEAIKVLVYLWLVFRSVVMFSKSMMQCPTPMCIESGILDSRERNAMVNCGWRGKDGNGEVQMTGKTEAPAALEMVGLYVLTMLFYNEHLWECHKHEALLVGSAGMPQQILFGKIC